jgi:hypothetical protein
MIQQSTAFAPSVPPRTISPISCPHCTASAYLVRREPVITGDGKGEIRTFTCIHCFERTETFVRG